MSQKSTTEKKVSELQARMTYRQADLENILMERIRDKEHAQVYTTMIEKCETDIQKCREQIDGIRNFDVTIKKRKTEMKANMELINEIISAGAISDTHLRMLVDKIIITEHNSKLQIEICIKAQFRMHLDFYDENGEINEKCFEIAVLPA